MFMVIAVIGTSTTQSANTETTAAATETTAAADADGDGDGKTTAKPSGVLALNTGLVMAGFLIFNF